MFSIWVRLRDKRCVRCSSYVELNARDIPVTHQCSHFFGRGMESVRFDAANADTLCHGCHRYWEKEDREGYRAFKVRQLGQDGFDKLQLRAFRTNRKDRELAKIYWRQRILEDFGIKV